MSIYDYTTNFNFPLSNFDTPNWHEEDWARWRLVDGLIANQSTIPFTVTTGSSNAYVATYTPAITAYTPNLQLSFKTNFANTGAATVNVNGLGAKALKLNGEDLLANDLVAGAYVRVIYDGTDFAVVDPKRTVNQTTDVIITDTGGTKNASTALLIEKAANTYLELLGSNISTQGYMFSRPTASYVGGVQYDHVNEELIFIVDGNIVANFDAAGILSANRFSGPLTGNVTGSATSLATARNFTYTGDATGSLSFDGTADVSAALTIASNAVTNAKLADVPSATIKGRSTAGTGDPEDLNPTQATAILNNYTVDTGSGGLKGLVPAPAAGTAALGKVLTAGGWGNAVPPGTIVMYGGTLPPGGWLVCDGAQCSRTTYADLFSAIATIFGVGDGSTTFNVPDFRGEFARGFDAGRNVDVGRILGSAQADEIRSHNHQVTPPTSADTGGQGQTATGTGGAESINTYNTASTGGAETRPRNIAVNFIIKF